VKIRRLTDTGEWTTRRYLSLLGNLLIWIIVAIDAWYMWPTQLGGDTAIVVVSGQSMEPNYFGGDLVIARKMEPSVGDAIVYAPKDLGGSQIVHRIIGGSADEGWQMKGDNNDFIDPFTPKGDEVKGVVLVHYSNFGRVTVLLLNPIVWALVLLAAMVLMLWYTGDECEERNDDDEDKDKDKGDGAGQDDPEPDSEKDLDLIDRVVEGTEAAVARMVAAGADAAAAALAVLRRPAPAPRHAAKRPRQSAPALLRGSAIVALLGLVAFYGPSTASASQLIVKPAAEVSVTTDAKCATQNLAVTPAGVPAGTQYSQITVSNIAPACLNKPINVYLHNSAGAIISTFSSTTPASGSTMTLTLGAGATYNASLVTKAVAKVKGWLFVPTWSYTAPVTGPITCIELSAWPGNAWEAPATYGTPTGNTCTMSYTSIDLWGGTPPKQFNLYFTVSGTTTGNWRVTINFADPYFQGWVPNNLSGNDNPLAAPGYVCGQLPIFVGQANLNWAAGDRNTGYLYGKSVGSNGNIC